jgi:hypothetical protein
VIRQTGVPTPECGAVHLIRTTGTESYHRATCIFTVKRVFLRVLQSMPCGGRAADHGGMQHTSGNGQGTGQGAGSDSGEESRHRCHHQQQHQHRHGEGKGHAFE